MIDYFQLNNPLTKYKSIFVQKARRKMYEHFINTAKPTEKDKVLDMGVTPEISLPESNSFEKMYPYTHNITMSTVEDASNLEQVFEGAVFVRSNAEERFPFYDKQFDVLFCSAVLEHVGDDKEQKFFVEECIRVSRKAYLTTPNKSFPVEFHTYLPFVHYLPQRIHQKILRALKMDFWADTANLNLLTRKRLFSLVPDCARDNAKVTYIRLLGIATNLILYVED